MKKTNSDNSNQKLELGYYAHIVGREVLGVPIELHFDCLHIIAKQNNAQVVELTNNSITATQKQYDELLILLLKCIYQN